MSNVQTTHANDEKGRQITRRTVTITDEDGEETEHEFRELENGDHEYLGEGTPPESATEALEEYLK